MYLKEFLCFSTTNNNTNSTCAETFLFHILFSKMKQKRATNMKPGQCLMDVNKPTSDNVHFVGFLRWWELGENK